MLKKIVKGALLLGSAGVGISYSLSLLASLLYGWPKRKNRIWRSLHPQKVYAFNYALLQLIYIKMKYLIPYVQWKLFYDKAGHNVIRKNLVYGRNDKTLDLYIPPGVDVIVPRPVVIFVYGGSWSSGDKTMYGPLCYELALKLKSFVCCPNYSTHPSGFVDDMIQDIVDSISWVYNSVDMYGGDKDKIMLIGHSAGAHLSAMAVLELLHEQLILGEAGPSQYNFQSGIHFEESHFEASLEGRSRTDTLDESSGSSGSFTVLNENGEKTAAQSSVTSASTFEVLSGTDGNEASLNSMEKESEKMEESAWTEVGSGDMKESVEMTHDQSEVIDKKEEKEEQDKSDNKTHRHSGGGGSKDTGESDEDDDDDSIVTVKHKDIDSQPSLLELGKSVKAVIGLAGVYHIRDHLAHEATRGVDDISYMERAMYGQECFERFSPTHVVKTLPVGISLPHIELLHGSEDYTVPVSSTTKFAEALQERCRNVGIRIIQECDHYELCLDLTDPGRKFYEPVMEVILQVASRTLR